MQRVNNPNSNIGLLQIALEDRQQILAHRKCLLVVPPISVAAFQRN